MKQEIYLVGEDVEGLYQNGIWYRAKVNSIHEDGMYLLDWNDGDPQDRKKSAASLRKIPPGSASQQVRCIESFTRIAGNFFHDWYVNGNLLNLS